jgi:branched-chain amino acid transport system permease protein
MQYWIDVVNQGLIFSIFAVSLNVILGYCGQLSVAPAGLGGIAGYMAAYLSAKQGVGFVPALAAGVAAALVVGIVLGVPALRLGPDYLILLTLAFASIVGGVLFAIPALGGTYGILGIKSIDFGGELRHPTQYLRLVALVAAISVLFCWRMAASPFGRVLRAIREDEEATQALGKDVVQYKIATFALTSAVAGVGGVLIVYYNQIASTTEFDFNATIIIVGAVIIGGMGNLLGSFVGAMVLTFTQPVLERIVTVQADTAALLRLVVYGLLLILFMRLRPSGLIPEGMTPRIANWKSLTRRPVHGWRHAAPSETERVIDRVPGTNVPNGASGAAAAHVVTANVPKVEAHGVVLEDNGLRPAATNPVLVARGLVKHFGGIRAVDGLDLALAEGRITALVGPNGAGKTTVFNLLTGRIRPDSGRVVLRGSDITGMPPHDVLEHGMVRSFQDVRTLTRMTVLDNVRLGVPDQPGERLRDLYSRPKRVRSGERKTTERALECLSFVGLERQADTIAGRLAYGDQKLLAIARVLATGADVLLIDEPAAGIDRGSLEPVLEVIERLREVGKTICIVEHNLDVVARLADPVLFMESGQVTAGGTMEEIKKIARLAEVYFGHV